jgi:Polysaccharide deacetylase
MISKKILVMRILSSFLGVLKTHYPSFIFGFSPAPHKIPVFVYHDVDADEFESDLTFLRINGYHTLSIDQFFDAHGSKRNDRCVLLTFDDARRTFWETAFPLLCKFDARATVFVPTFWINGNSVNHDEPKSPASYRSSFMTWDELRACGDSRLVDVQSHGHRHALVYTSPHLVAFSTPDLLRRKHVYQWPMRRSGGKDLCGFPPLGTPVYGGSPLLSAKARFLENEEATKKCQDFVRKNGGSTFFDHKGWISPLRYLHNRLTADGAAPVFMESRAFQDLVVSEFQASCSLLQSHLGFGPKYFAYPWMLGSKWTLKTAFDAGIRAVFGVASDYRRIRFLSSPLPIFYRIKGDWLRFLPGKNRASLKKIVPAKLQEFRESQNIAH